MKLINKSMIWVILALSCWALNDAALKYGFSWLNFTFESPSDYDEYLNNSTFKNCTIAGVKVNSLGEYFVSVPRWKSGVPATLNKIVVNGSFTLLEPFPNWQENQGSDPWNLQSVLGFEIDNEDRLWVLDQGRVADVPVPGSTKVKVFNSKTGDFLKYFDLTSVADPSTSFLNDLVYDKRNNYLYITDSGIPAAPGPVLGSLIVVDVTRNLTKQILYNSSFTNPDPGLWININGAKVNSDSPMSTGADGIALTCEGDLLYWTPLTSRTLYAIETQYLRRDISNYHSYVVTLGYKLSASDGLATSSSGSLYLTAIEQNAIYRIENTNMITDWFNYMHFETIAQNSSTMIWPDTIGFNNQARTIVFVSNQLQNFEDGSIDWNTSGYNFRIWEVEVNDRSYLYGCNKDESVDDSSDFPTWVLPVVVVFVLIILAMLTLYCYKKFKKPRRYSIMNEDRETSQQ